MLVCLVRLVSMQVLSEAFYREQIAELKQRSSSSKQLRTARGRILDRNGKVLAGDEPRFQLGISYQVGRFRDPRAWPQGVGQEGPHVPGFGPRDELEGIIDKCTYFGARASTELSRMSRREIEERVDAINERIWNLRTFIAWARNAPSKKLLEQYEGNLNSIPLSEAIADFERQFPDRDKRLELIGKIDDIAEMERIWPLVELETDDDVFAAQVEFLDTEGVEIVAEGRRVYPFGSVAAQTIGWVGPPQQRDKSEFATSRLSSYLDDELCGREDGVEYVCESILRGRRGELVYDIDRQLISRTETQFGQDVSLTIDIELQGRIELYLAEARPLEGVPSGRNSDSQGPIGLVLIDVESGDILALVSVPTFDLNYVRRDYGKLAENPDEPLRNRALYKEYPPGSVIKPLILIAGLESGKITPSEVISCPAQAAPAGWPSCWIYNRYAWLGHDSFGTNSARNAIKGSCNIYFSRLADRIEAVVLQNWLYRFGYGHIIPLGVGTAATAAAQRDFRQYPGQISNTRPGDSAGMSFEQLPELLDSEKRWFGIGHGNCRVTVLQAANAMATIARGGILKRPKLFRGPGAGDRGPGMDLGISEETLGVVYDGMFAVVNEPDGTAYKEFEYALSGLANQAVKVYGKTGSTEKPDNAWFAGFAKDNSGSPRGDAFRRAVAIAVVVEGGQHGSSDAAPLARDTIQFAIEAGYLGPTQVSSQ